MNYYDETMPPSERNKRLFQRAFWTLFVLVLVATSYALGRSHARIGLGDEDTPLSEAYITHAQSRTVTPVDFGLFWDAWEVLKRDYVDRKQLKAQDLIYGAIDGMLAATGDPYTTFFDPKELASFNEEITGTFEGIGAEIGIRDGVLTIITPLDESPAQRAGLRAGDAILKIDGALTSSMSIDEAVRHIRGPRGTTVTLTIFRKGHDEPQDISVTRDEIVVASVTSTVEDGGVGYVRIRRFGPDTARAFVTQTRHLVREAHITSLVIDLRNNPGGYLEGAVEIAGTMLPHGATVVMSEDAKGKRKIYRADNTDYLRALPTVVLINEGSASASEILAGALRDNRDDVVLVGKKSFGKGSVQELISLTKGAVKVTVARWLTPKGDQINKVGITPQEEVAFTEEDFAAGRDTQKERALAIARERAAAGATP